MARQINRLNARKIAALTAPGMHADGAGLYLRISNGRVVGKRWVFIYRYRGRRREMGLGSAATVSLARAREKVSEARDALDREEDPLRSHGDDRVPTFHELAKEHIKVMSPSWRNAKHRQQWNNSLTTHASTLLDKRVD